MRAVTCLHAKVFANRLASHAMSEFRFLWLRASARAIFARALRMPLAPLSFTSRFARAHIYFVPVSLFTLIDDTDIMMRALATYNTALGFRARVFRA